MILPRDAAVEGEPESVVVEVAEPVADALDLLDEKLHGFGRPVREPGVVVGEDLVPPGGDGASESGQLGHLRFGAALVEPGEPAAGMGEIEERR